MNANASPIDFDFPFTAYSIQRDFMTALYNVLSNGKIGIFESPTGTGKSLSLICGSLRWLKDQQNQTQEYESTIEDSNDTDEPDWVRAFKPVSEEQRKRNEWKRQKEKIQERIQRVRLYREDGVISVQAQPRVKKHRVTRGVDQDDDDEFLVDEYYSDDEAVPVPQKNQNTNLSKDVLALLTQFDAKEDNTSDDQVNTDDHDSFEQQKIYYASRTHSQLSQFIREVNKTSYSKDIWSTSLGSRRNLCINDEVRKLKSLGRMNEACMDLQKEKSKRCPHLPAWNDKDKWDTFQDHALLDIIDIEDLQKLGKTLNTCPYYGSRYIVKPSQLVVLPYQHLLHASTRESLGISLKDNIVIIDEAHNLIETITSIHTVCLYLNKIKATRTQLERYLEKYKNRLLGKNMVYIKQLITITKALVQLLENGPQKDRVLGVNECIHELGIDYFNMFKIEKYLHQSHLGRKLNGFIDKLQQDKSTGQDTPKDERTRSPHQPSALAAMSELEAFLMALTNPDKDGRVILQFDETQPSIKYMLLNPAEIFRPIVEEAKSVVLAGGTMEPISDFMRQLFADVPQHRITTFSCGHIIPSSNLLTLSMDQGPTGKPFIFNFDHRQDAKLMDEAGQALVNLCNMIPDGVVCFFPSFSYMELMVKRWGTAEGGNVLERISRKKKVFREPKEAHLVEPTLRDYAMQIDINKGGALLLSVVNGKLSEGINFSDRLGRGIIMIGLPFANRTSVELNEKIAYAKSHARADGTQGTDAGVEYYENLCMRGVNQSIGRAIRHRDDYAVIVLLDKRYSGMRIVRKLPGWIGSTLEHCTTFGQAMSKTGQFFRNKK